MNVYKGFRKGLVSVRGKSVPTRMKRGKNVEQEANCRKNGWHAAENPLDCLSYYGMNEENEFYKCEALGDIDEIDGMISCTELIVGEKLTLEQFVAEAVRFILYHPSRKNHCLVSERAVAKNGFAIVRGEHPSAVGEDGDILAFLVENERGKIVNVALKRVGENILSGTSYTMEADGKIYPDGRVIRCE